MAETYSIAFIGTGVMGASMAAHLLDAGHRLRVFTRTRAKAAGLIERGARWCDTPGEAAAEADFVITMVGYPRDVEEVYFGAGGVLGRMPSGTIAIDMTTSSARLAEKIAAAAQARGGAALDAPVSGGDVGAREARLAIMVGGDEAAFARAQPLLARLGKNIVRQGGPGAGQYCKMANQIAVAVGMLAWAEALAFGAAAGLDPARVLASIGGGAAGSWAMTNLAPRALAENFAPGFYVKHMVKDIGIALECAAELGVDTPGLATAKKAYDQVVAAGWAECGTQAIYRVYGRGAAR